MKITYISQPLKNKIDLILREELQNIHTQDLEKGISEFLERTVYRLEAIVQDEINFNRRRYK